MDRMNKHLYEFGSFQLDAEERLLRRDDNIIPLTPKAFDLLLVLVKQPGHLLEKEVLLEAVWPNSFVEEHNLADNISKLRKALGEGENGQKFIETIPKHGYRFAMVVREVDAPGFDRILNDPHLPTATTSVLTALAKSNEAAPVLSLAPLSTSPLSAEKPILPKPALVTGRTWKASLLFVSIAILGISAWLTLNRATQKNILTSISTTTPPTTAELKADSSAIKSIAILPFKQLTPHKDDAYLGLGIADTLINRLSIQRQVQVRPLNAALAADDSDALATGRAQKVDAVLEGTVQHVGNQLRVRVRLLRISDGNSLWTETYDFTWQDFFATQDAIAKQIVKALALQLSTERQATIAKPLTSNAEALQLYLKGRYIFNRYALGQNDVALNLFQQAIAKDPTFAQAYVGMAESYMRRGFEGNFNTKESWEHAQAAAQKASEIDPQLATAYSLLGAIELDSLKAEQFCRQALELDPNSDVTQVTYSLALTAQGKFQAAEAVFQRVLARNPLQIGASLAQALLCFYARQFEQTIEISRRILAIEANHTMVHFIIGDALTQLARYDEAVAEYELGCAAKGSAENDDQIAAAFALSGKRDEALLILNNLKAIAKKRYVPSFNLARICIALGDKEQALAYLKVADEERAGEMRFIKVDPRFVSLHRDPRFQEILRHRNLHD
jgi:DNA-binding winged helix-turn-helix (wHTH) protein/TolB-like protein